MKVIVEVRGKVKTLTWKGFERLLAKAPVTEPITIHDIISETRGSYAAA